ncbi:MAG TPA: protein-L-isoaspartate(D-aspartate) O-methyltransferase [Candidatus Omnitrophica bacterium]|nr:protein-L-isoaspartate(D-aspartate) O-methyltransferase [Candidatus Omnitrophota bacterium]
MFNSTIERAKYPILIFVLILTSYQAFSAEESNFEKARRFMVTSQIEGRRINDEATLEAMLSVPRHKFVPPEYIRAAYGDHPLPIGEGQTISQPYIVALMTEKLKLNPSDKVLEIGTGSGYQAAVLSKICEEVYTVEIIPSLGEKAKKRLQNLGYDNVTVKIGDGYYGWEEHSPFDAIIVTAAATHIPPPLIEQLKVGGRMVIPIGGVFQIQRLMFIEKKADGKLESKNLIPVRFVPLRGGHD